MIGFIDGCPFSCRSCCPLGCGFGKLPPLPYGAAKKRTRGHMSRAAVLTCRSRGERIARNGPEGMEYERGRVEDLHPRLFVHVELAWARHQRFQNGEVLGDPFRDCVLSRHSASTPTTPHIEAADLYD